METAWIDGKPASLEEALRAAGTLLGKARQPLVTGLRTDVAGVRAAFLLALRAGGIVDHAKSAGLYPFIAAARDGGAFLAAPGEMRRRADRVLIVGDEPATIGADLLRMLAETTPDLGVRSRGAGRSFMAVSRQTVTLPGGVESDHLDCASDDVVDLLGMVRAKLGGRRVGEGAVGDEVVETVARFLSEAGFAAIIFSPSEFGEIGTEQIFGLAEDLNQTTRASTLLVVADPDALGAALQATWTSGFPLRISHGRGEWEHDPALFSSERQIAKEGEADVVVYVDALAGADTSLPPPEKPTILIAAGSGQTSGAKVAFKVGAAGRDHDGVLYNARFGDFVATSAETKSELPTAAGILDALASQLGENAEKAA
ncbi:hypothetical protein [Jiella mangrovi]|uniref:Tungsten formylmethanofuran dehydrogenase n=1 Tax=Jiella mangrovi TaxID=2821407 RepID=A0ABS4BGQ0_9HYPH|nr:hypothetical protein [Jiella mangrovi]MBP0615125.1 hypothetical protein [Jiella mangrovi]